MARLGSGHRFTTYAKDDRKLPTDEGKIRVIATNVTLEALVKAERDNGVLLSNVRKLSATRYAFVLRPTIEKDKLGNHKWQRTSASYSGADRRVFAVCWHGHRAFLETLFEECPQAIVRSGLGGRKVVHRGAVDTDTAWIPLGPPIMGGYPRACEACSCPYSGTDGPDYGRIYV